MFKLQLLFEEVVKLCLPKKKYLFHCIFKVPRDIWDPMGSCPLTMWLSFKGMEGQLIGNFELVPIYFSKQKNIAIQFEIQL